MPFTEKSQPEEVETLVDTLTMEGATLNEAQLSALSHCDLQQLAELSQELHLSNEMGNQSGDSDVLHMSEDGDHTDAEEIIVQPELGAQEVEIETERAQSPEEILPDIKNNKPSVPPLRPLTIAPKPAKVPIAALKPVTGQQLLLVQGTGGTQAIKFVSPQGQELNLANISLARPVTIKQAVKTITTPSSISVVQPKQVVMKKVIAPANKAMIPRTAVAAGKQGHIMVVQKPESQIKLVQNQSNVTLPNPTKTITLQQAQEMGLITTKLVPQTSGKHAVVLNKTQAKTIKIVPQQQIKSPTKILPAPQTTSANKVAQRIILKPANTGQQVLSSQIIQMPQPIGSGQLHQINIPGKGVQYIKFVTTSSADTVATTPTSASSGRTVISSQVPTSSVAVKPTNIVLSEVKALQPASSIAPKPIKPAVATRPVQIATPTASQVVVVPSYIPQNPKVAIPPQRPPPRPVEPAPIIPPPPPADANLESNGMRPRKPCNCTKSQCLKLYCDCFANGEFCHMCNCMNCFNNIENEEHRQRAIKNCLERNPYAFRPKIGKAKDNTGEVAIRKHTKGCNCKRSGCLKNYCECYEAKIACSNNCKCIGCRNIEDAVDKKGRSQINSDSTLSASSMPGNKSSLATRDGVDSRQRKPTNSRQAFNFITNDVVEATSQCLLALTDNAETNATSNEDIKKQIIEEFGRCLTEIINCSIARAASASN